MSKTLTEIALQVKQTVKRLLDNLTNNYGTWPRQKEQHD